MSRLVYKQKTSAVLWQCGWSGTDKYRFILIRKIKSVPRISVIIFGEMVLVVNMCRSFVVTVLPDRIAHVPETPQ